MDSRILKNESGNANEASRLIAKLGKAIKTNKNCSKITQNWNTEQEISFASKFTYIKA